MKPLSRNTSELENQYPEKILQFGGGNFLRGFVDWMVDVLNESTDFAGSVVLVKPTPNGDYHQLRNQDGLFHLVLDGMVEGKAVSQVHLVRSIGKIISAYQQWEEFIRSAQSPTIRFVVSNTTEAGIRFNPQDQPDSQPPIEFPGKLTRWLYHRYVTFEGAHDKGCIMLPCELIQNNGARLKACILEYARAWNLNEGFQDWILNHNQFCNTLVDRIVSGYPEDRGETILSKIGYQDSQLVAAEWYHSWVIEGPDELQHELPFQETKLNVKFVKDIRPYHRLKVRILNGAHTALVPIGLLSGYNLVDQAIDDPTINEFVRALLIEEVTPTLDLSKDQIDHFIKEVLDRFNNRTLKHKLISIALNSTSKFVTRLLPSLKEFYKLKETLPARIVMSLAALIRLYEGSWSGHNFPLKDDPETLDFLTEQWGKFRKQEIDLENLVESTLSKKSIWGEDLTMIPKLNLAVYNSLEIILSNGISASLNQFN